MRAEEVETNVPSGTPKNPFLLSITANDSTTLADIAVSTALSLTDLRSLNPSLDAYSVTDSLPVGSAIQLPPVLSVRGDAYGSYFTVGDAEGTMRRLELALDALLESERSNIPKLPERKVRSKTEKIVAKVRDESERQLERIKREFSECAGRSNLLQFLVDIEPVKSLHKELEWEYNGTRLNLRAMETEHRELFSKPTRERPSRAVAESSRYNVVDRSEDFCVAEHSYRWEFTVLAPDSITEVQETWAVLSCQNIGVLVDTLECRNCLPTRMSKNAFLFIGGTFYVDNRHAGSDTDEYEDLTIPIRQFNPCLEGNAHCPKAGPVERTAFGNCPVKYVSQTTFADLNVRLGEFGLLRHIGWCNHYFYLSSAMSLSASDCCDRERGAYPQRVMRAPVRAVRCRLCRSHPSTVICYNDELSPESPCPYCVPCFELLHATDEGVVADDQFVTYKFPKGKYLQA